MDERTGIYDRHARAERAERYYYRRGRVRQHCKQSRALALISNKPGRSERTGGTGRNLPMHAPVSGRSMFSTSLPSFGAELWYQQKAEIHFRASANGRWTQDQMCWRRVVDVHEPDTVELPDRAGRRSNE